MKKYLAIASCAAALLAAGCAKNEVIEESIPQHPVTFGVYAGQAATKATYGDINTTALTNSQDGFGVFAYYTKEYNWNDSSQDWDNEVEGSQTYGEATIPNFMYNQQVRNIASYAAHSESNPSDYSEAKYPGGWYYTPLKYWPNGQNSTTYEASTTSADKVSFFAYAPHTAAAPSTGVVGTPYPAANQGITAMTSNNTKGAPTITFTVPSAAENQIDLLWAIPIKNVTKQELDGRVSFAFKHALAKLNFQVQAVVDAVDAVTNSLTDDGDETIEHGETWIILQNLDVTATGVPNTGTLVLDSEALDVNSVAVPTWTSTRGNTSINYTNSSFASTKTADGKTGFKVTEGVANLNSSISPMIIPATVTTGNFRVSVNYWVITKDDALFTGYSTIQNQIWKTNTANITFKAGYKYNIIVKLGLNSVDFDVTVANWDTDDDQVIHLPQNVN